VPRKKPVELQIVVRTSPQACFDALVDFEAYPRWQRAVRTCEIKSHDRNGRAKQVSFVIDSELGSIAYTLDYSYESPHLITWDFIDGDVDGVDGELVLEDRGDGTTLATYAMRIDPGVSVSGTAASALNLQLAQESIGELKARVESGA
jgi:uncharacterized protein YndB with AHSA1/START domain